MNTVLIALTHGLQFIQNGVAQADERFFRVLSRIGLMHHLNIARRRRTSCFHHLCKAGDFMGVSAGADRLRKVFLKRLIRRNGGYCCIHRLPLRRQQNFFRQGALEVRVRGQTRYQLFRILRASGPFHGEHQQRQCVHVFVIQRSQIIGQQLDAAFKVAAGDLGRRHAQPCGSMTGYVVGDRRHAAENYFSVL
ncbi:hypothetical protein HCH_05125 [Hahella chejuensis KCTC 2396]|uniref:Uncharacterized protein n=1 Tax=Hahella chejuensis (strain KCTC 2396) TaxID=349521 RepID=Q2SC20_HAHCH|nr:hypothetical protein HCH_05125 [Hahella chejuensis KCTC 2396]